MSKNWIRYAACVVAVSVCVPAAFADKAKKSLAHCTTFDQVDKDDDTVQFSIKNTCEIPIDCSISWKVVCAPDSKKRRASHPGTSKITSLSNDATQTADATASVCGNDSWSIEQVEWSCAPNKD